MAQPRGSASVPEEAYRGKVCLYRTYGDTRARSEYTRYPFSRPESTRIVHRPTETLDTPAILKGETAETDTALDDAKKMRSKPNFPQPPSNEWVTARSASLAETCGFFRPVAWARRETTMALGTLWLPARVDPNLSSPDGDT